MLIFGPIIQGQMTQNTWSKNKQQQAQVSEFIRYVARVWSIQQVFVTHEELAKCNMFKVWWLWYVGKLIGTRLVYLGRVGGAAWVWKGILPGGRRGRESCRRRRSTWGGRQLQWYVLMISRSMSSSRMSVPTCCSGEESSWEELTRPRIYQTLVWSSWNFTK